MLVVVLSLVMLGLVILVVVMLVVLVLEVTGLKVLGGATFDRGGGGVSLRRAQLGLVRGHERNCVPLAPPFPQTFPTLPLAGSVPRFSLRQLHSLSSLGAGWSCKFTRVRCQTREQRDT